MTEPTNDQTPRRGQRDEEPAARPDDRSELDAEMVRDLEADEHSDDVRGGACPKSRPV
jgi:hypothetical protein